MSPLLQEMNNGESTPAAVLEQGLRDDTTSGRLTAQGKRGDLLVNWGPKT